MLDGLHMFWDLSLEWSDLLGDFLVLECQLGRVTTIVDL